MYACICNCKHSYILLSGEMCCYLDNHKISVISLMWKDYKKKRKKKTKNVEKLTCLCKLYDDYYYTLPRYTTKRQILSVDKSVPDYSVPSAKKRVKQKQKHWFVFSGVQFLFQAVHSASDDKLFRIHDNRTKNFSNRSNILFLSIPKKNLSFFTVCIL